MELRYCWVVCFALILTKVSTHHHEDHIEESSKLNETKVLTESKPEDHSHLEIEILSPSGGGPLISTLDQISNQDLVNLDSHNDISQNEHVPNAKETKEDFLLKSNDKIDHLQTSESRKRSKTEIKEVNGTLYEYEYIYYYDDEYPMYDYDTPGGDNGTISKTTPTLESTSEKLIPVNDSEPVTTSIPDIIIVETKQRSRSRQRTQNTLEGKLNSEIPSQSLSPSPRQKARQLEPSSRGQNDLRSIAVDNIAEENTVQDLQIESDKLPAQTRFPPRATPPSLEVINNSPVVKSGNIIESSKTNEAHLLSEKSAINLYAFSKVEDNNFVESSTVNRGEIVTEIPIEFDPLYEYDLTPKELEEIELLTTINNANDYEEVTAMTKEENEHSTTYPTDVYTTSDLIVTTEAPTTTTTTTTTTPTTTTTTTTESPSARRSFRGRGRFPLREGSKGIITNEINGNPETKDSENQASGNSASTSFHNRRRLGRLNLSTQSDTESTDAIKGQEQSSSKPDELSNSPNRRRIGLTRQRPTFKGHQNKLTATTENTVDTNTNAAEEVAHEEIKIPSLPSPSKNVNNRQRRPLPRNRLNRFNAKLSSSDGTESIDKVEQAQGQEAKESVPEGDVVNKDIPDNQDSAPAQTDQKNLRKDTSRNHRFNIGNRRKLGTRREKPSNEEVKTNVEPATTAINTAEEVTDIVADGKPSTEVNPPANRNFRRNNNKNLNRFNHRFRNRGNGPEKQDDTQTEVSDILEGKQVVASEPLEKTEHKTESHSAGTAERVSKFSRTINGNRADRRKTIPDRRRKPSQETQNKDETLQSEIPYTQHEEPAGEHPSEPAAAEEANINIEPVSALSKPEEEAPILTEDVTDASVPETTTEKLNRRQMLARRRNRFLNG